MSDPSKSISRAPTVRDGPLPVIKKPSKLRPFHEFNNLCLPGPDFTKRLPSYDENMEVVLKKFEDEKRSFSSLSFESITTANKTRQESSVSRGEFTREFRIAVETHVKGHKTFLEISGNTLSAHLRQLVNACHLGEITQEEFNQESSRTESELAHIRAHLVSLRLYRETIIGACMDTHRHANPHADLNIAYIDTLIEKCEPSAGGVVWSGEGKRHGSSHDELRQEMLAAYCCRNDANDLVWCCVTRQFWAKSEVIAAPLVPHAISELQACHLFGDDADDADDMRRGHLTSVRNVIPIFFMFEQALDTAQIAIVPAGDDDEDSGATAQSPDSIPLTGRFKVVVLDPTFAKDWRPSQYGLIQDPTKIDGSLLGFRSDFRPAKQCLYFRLVFNILRRRRYEVAAWQKPFLRFLGKDYWSSPGGYLRHSTMAAMARRIGCVTKLEEVFEEKEPSVWGSSEETDQDYIIVDEFFSSPSSYDTLHAELPGYYEEEEDGFLMSDDD